MGERSSVWPVRARVAAHTLAGLLLGAAVTVTAVTGEVTAAAASAAALVFVLQAGHTEATVSRAQRTIENYALRAAAAEDLADAVRVRGEQTLDMVGATATATAALPQTEADQLLPTVLAYRDHLDHPHTPQAAHRQGANRTDGAGEGQW